MGGGGVLRGGVALIRILLLTVGRKEGSLNLPTSDILGDSPDLPHRKDTMSDDII